MKVNIGKAIRLVLEEKHRATLPGIGTFRVVLSPASYSKDKSKINPPSAKLNFSDKTVNDQSLSDFISQLYNLSRTETLKYLNAFNDKLKAGLDKKASVKVQDLGRFLKNDKGNIEFIANKGIEKSFFYGLKPVRNSLAPSPAFKAAQESKQSEKHHFGKEIAVVQATKESAMTDNYNTDYEYGDDRSKWSFLLRPLLLIAALVLLSVLMVKMCSKKADEGKADTGAETVGLDSTPTDKETTDLDSQTAGQSDIEQANQEAIDADQETKLDETTSADYQEDELLEEEAIDEAYSDSNTDSDNLLQDDYDSEVIDNEPEQIDVNKVIAPDAHIKPLLIEDLEKQPVNCIIVTGSFRELSNAVRMQKKLEAAGYDSYAERINGLTRVGFFFVCEEEDLKSFIYNIRAELAADAWYLWPRLHVE